MRLYRFRVKDYRNILDSGWITVNQVTAFVGQNESGKSNLFEALYCLNPIIRSATYNPDEDWPVDQWQGKANAKGTQVCEAELTLELDEFADLYAAAATQSTGEATPPTTVTIAARRSYDSETQFEVTGVGEGVLDKNLAAKWVAAKMPKFVYISEYEMSGERVELDQLKQRWDNAGRANRHALTNEDQTVLIILDLAKIDLDDFLQKSGTPEGRTVRSFDKRSASKYLTKQFQHLWTQKAVEFNIEIDGPTLNIFAEDQELGMPVRLKRRSTGFRWYVSFAWKFTHATQGEFKNCILLLVEPGIHLHYSGQKDLLETFERLAADNTILYTTHLASMVDLANPERVRIVESRNHHLAITEGVVSSQRAPMAVIERCLGLSGDLSGMLGNRQVLIVEGGIDALILHKLSGLLAADEKGLSDHIFLWPAQTATKTPMYAAFAIGQEWDAGVLLDTDEEGAKAKEKINSLYLSKLAEERQKRFRVFMLGKAAGIKKTDAAVEDIFPNEFYLECVNSAFGLAIKMEDLPKDGSDMIAKRIEEVLRARHGHQELDKDKVLSKMLQQFDRWDKASDLPGDTAEKATQLFKTINAAFSNVR